MKASPRKLIGAHYGTLVDRRTGRLRWQDHLLFEGVPAALVAASLVLQIELSSGVVAALLTVTGILAAFLFGAMLQVAERALDWSDLPPQQGPETSRHAQILHELASNSGYAALVSIAAALAFVVASVATGPVLVVATAIGLGLGAHLILVLLLVVVRVFSLTEERLRGARTGHLASLHHLPPTRTGTDD